MSRPIHFEIHAADAPGAIAFYSALLGWTFTPLGDTYHLIKTGEDVPGIDGGLVRRMGENPVPKEPTSVIAYVCTIGVDDVDAYVAKAHRSVASQPCRRWRFWALAGWLASRTPRATSSA